MGVQPRQATTIGTSVLLMFHESWKFGISNNPPPPIIFFIINLGMWHSLVTVLHWAPIVQWHMECLTQSGPRWEYIGCHDFDHLFSWVVKTRLCVSYVLRVSFHVRPFAHHILVEVWMPPGGIYIYGGWSILKSPSLVMGSPCTQWHHNSCP